MNGFPKVLKTKADIVNTFKLTKKGRYKKEEWLEAIKKLENQNFLFCPLVELSEDRKEAKLNFCNEAAAGQKVNNGTKTVTIKTVDVEEETVEEATETTEAKTIKYTILTFSAALLSGSTEIGIPVSPTIYERYSITEEELEQMKGEIEAL